MDHMPETGSGQADFPVGEVDSRAFQQPRAFHPECVGVIWHSGRRAPVAGGGDESTGDPHPGRSAAATRVDAIVRNHFRHDPVKLAAWKHARHVERLANRDRRSHGSHRSEGLALGTGGGNRDGAAKSATNHRQATETEFRPWGALSKPHFGNEDKVFVTAPPLCTVHQGACRFQSRQVRRRSTVCRRSSTRRRCKGSLGRRHSTVRRRHPTLRRFIGGLGRFMSTRCR